MQVVNQNKCRIKPGTTMDKETGTPMKLAVLHIPVHGRVCMLRVHSPAVGPATSGYSKSNSYGLQKSKRAQAYGLNRLPLPMLHPAGTLLNPAPASAGAPGTTMQRISGSRTATMPPTPIPIGTTTTASVVFGRCRLPLGEQNF